MTVNRSINYETLAQDAMRSVVRTVLSQAAKFGLPGDHHFYISFHTQAPGVVLSKRLRERYPEEMTIVLQHRFWDLSVADDRFDVKLTFDGIPERIGVPFAALKIFFDPSVRYGFQFDDAETPSAENSNDMSLPADFDAAPASNSTRAPPARLPAPRKPRMVRKPRSSDKTTADDAQASRVGDEDSAAPVKPGADPEPTDKEKPESGAEIFRLDAFRKR